LATNSSRILTHLVVLLIAAAIPVTASLTAAAHAQRFTAVPLAAQAAAPEPIENYVLTQRGVFLKPAVAVTEPTERRADPTRYQVQSGDTIGHIAARFGLRMDSVRWANRLADIDTLKIGQELLIPPVNGVLVQVAGGDTAAGLAAKYKADTQTIIEFNLLRDPENLVAGTAVMIPDGQGEEYVPPPAPKRVVAAPPVTPQLSGGGINRFPWGYCTWWVASKRYVPWSGNAWEWWANARAYGYAEGQTPRPGAIMVTWESSVGHVAYVESVNGDGSFSVSEMNYHFIRGQINYRTITPSQLGRIGLLGFIY
jgi:LysM repeat protein